MLEIHDYQLKKLDLTEKMLIDLRDKVRIKIL